MEMLRFCPSSMLTSPSHLSVMKGLEDVGWGGLPENPRPRVTESEVPPDAHLPLHLRGRVRHTEPKDDSLPFLLLLTSLPFLGSQYGLLTDLGKVETKGTLPPKKASCQMPGSSSGLGS